MFMISLPYPREHYFSSVDQVSDVGLAKAFLNDVADDVRIAQRFLPKDKAVKVTVLLAIVDSIKQEAR